MWILKKAVMLFVIWTWIIVKFHKTSEINVVLS